MQIKELAQLSWHTHCCVLPHSSRAQLSTPAKLINRICLHVSSSAIEGSDHYMFFFSIGRTGGISKFAKEGGAVMDILWTVDTYH